MKYILPLLLCAVLLIFAFNNTSKECDLARIHIIANSDSKEDIALKMKVSDSVAKLLEKEKFNDIESLEKGLEEKLPEIIDIAEKTVKSEAYEYEVKGEVGTRYFEKKELSGSMLPEGEYLSLIITLGEGKGHNWWSVLFPDVTFGASLALGEEGKGGKTVFFEGIGLVKIRSLLLDIFRY